MPQWWPFGLPSDENGFYKWVAALMAAYLFVAYFLSWKRDKQLFPKGYGDILTIIFNAATFAASTMLLLGTISDDVLKAIGSVKGYLLVAGFAGVLYGLHALRSTDP